MRGCKNIIMHVLGTAAIVGITAYVSMPSSKRQQLNKKMSDITKEKITDMKDIYKDCMCD